MSFQKLSPILLVFMIYTVSHSSSNYWLEFFFDKEGVNPTQKSISFYNINRSQNNNVIIGFDLPLLAYINDRDLPINPALLKTKVYSKILNQKLMEHPTLSYFNQVNPPIDEWVSAFSSLQEFIVMTMLLNKNMQTPYRYDKSTKLYFMGPFGIEAGTGGTEGKKSGHLFTLIRQALQANRAIIQANELKSLSNSLKENVPDALNCHFQNKLDLFIKLMSNLTNRYPQSDPKPQVPIGAFVFCSSGCIHREEEHRAWLLVLIGICHGVVFLTMLASTLLKRRLVEKYILCLLLWEFLTFLRVGVSLAYLMLKSFRSINAIFYFHLSKFVHCLEEILSLCFLNVIGLPKDLFRVKILLKAMISVIGIFYFIESLIFSRVYMTTSIMAWNNEDFIEYKSFLLRTLFNMVYCGLVFYLTRNWCNFSVRLNKKMAENFLLCGIIFGNAGTVLVVIGGDIGVPMLKDVFFKITISWSLVSIATHIFVLAHQDKFLLRKIGFNLKRKKKSSVK